MMKKILIIHTRYTETGGEDIAVDNEIQFLGQNYQVETLVFQNTLKPNLLDLLAFIRNNNRDSVNKLQNSIAEFRPQYVYIHNLWFKGSLGILKYLIKNNMNVTIKLHNFRYYCTKSYKSSRHLDKNGDCYACGLSVDQVGYFNKYYTNSFLKSVLVNHFGKKYFKLLNSEKIKIVTLTNHHRKFLIELGINKKNIFIQPNPIPHLKNFKYKSKDKLNQVVYAGRISKEKGIEELIKAWVKLTRKNYSLLIIGDGPYFEEINKIVMQTQGISLLGYLSNEKVLKIISESKAVVTSTKLYEGQPTLLCEASALGVVSVFPDSGGIKEFFESDYQYSFKQFDYVDLQNKLQKIINNNNLDFDGFESRKYILKYLDEKKLLSNFETIFEERR